MGDFNERETLVKQPGTFFKTFWIFIHFSVISMCEILVASNLKTVSQVYVEFNAPVIEFLCVCVGKMVSCAWRLTKNFLPRFSERRKRKGTSSNTIVEDNK